MHFIHHHVRLIGIALSLILVIWGASFLPYSGDLSNGGMAQVAGVVGVQVGIEPNPYNMLDAQLREKELALNMRAQSLESDRAATNQMVNSMNAENAVRFYLLASVLLALVFGNFYWEFRLARKERKLEEEIARLRPSI